MFNADRWPLSITLRIDGLTVKQLSKVHDVADGSRTEAMGCPAKGRNKNVPETSGEVLVVEKAELSGRRYTALLRINARFSGHIHQPEGDMDALVHPSRKSLERLFDALGILSDQEVVQEHPDSVRKRQFEAEAQTKAEARANAEVEPNAEVEEVIAQE